MTMEAINRIRRYRGIGRGKTDRAQADWGGETAKEARAAATPVSQFRPSCSAKLRRLETRPAARRNLDAKRETVSIHASGLAPIRRRIGARPVSMAPRLSDRSMRPDLSTRSKYSVAVIGRMPRCWESDWIGHSQQEEGAQRGLKGMHSGIALELSVLSWLIEPD